MDTVRKLFAGKPIGDKRLWIALGAILILAAIIRPLVTGSTSPNRLASLPAPAASAPASRSAGESADTQIDQSYWTQGANKSKTGAPGATEQTPGGLLWKMLVSLAAVIALLVVGGILIKKYLVPRPAALEGRRVVVLESTRLAPRQSVHLVQAGTRKYLLAVSTEQVSLVADVTEAFVRDDAATQ